MIFLNENVFILLNLIVMYEIIKRGIKNPNSEIILIKGNGHCFYLNHNYSQTNP